MKIILLIGTAVLAALVGCSDPADKVSAAKVSSNTNQTAASVSADSEKARSFVFGPASGKIDFIGSKVTGSHNGGFKKFSGELLLLSDKKLAPSGNKVTIDTTSLWSDNEKLTGHLKSPDFFDVAKFPTSTFVTTDVSQEGTNSTVTGNLTLHGITKQISFPAAVQVSVDSVKIQANFSINRFDFEMKYPGKADDLIRKDIVLKIDMTAGPVATN
jgi:polyisoprenoid-binding protein YceI